MTRTEVVILIAEDDDGHAALIERNLSRAGISNEAVDHASVAAMAEGHSRGAIAETRYGLPAPARHQDAQGRRR